MLFWCCTKRKYSKQKNQLAIIFRQGSSSPSFTAFSEQIPPQSKKKEPETSRFRPLWQGQEDSNPRPTVLETGTLPAELYPCAANHCVHYYITSRGKLQALFAIFLFFPETNRKILPRGGTDERAGRRSSGWPAGSRVNGWADSKQTTAEQSGKRTAVGGSLTRSAERLAWERPEATASKKQMCGCCRGTPGKHNAAAPEPVGGAVPPAFRRRSRPCHTGDFAVTLQKKLPRHSTNCAIALDRTVFLYYNI